MARRRRRILASVLLTVTLLGTLGPNAWVWAASQGYVATLGSEEDTATAPVAIVLGASVYADGTPSVVLQRRLDTAVTLYEEGRVDAILVSGDNSDDTYNEPEAMRDYLLEQGIPAQAIAVDAAGLDTYSTCVRANVVYGVEEAIVVTQDFHAPRAVALCRAVGVEAQGVVDAETVAGTRSWWRSWLRERLASIKAAWDVLTHSTPELGEADSSVSQAVAWTQAQRG